jgi:hypothetical protein
LIALEASGFSGVQAKVKLRNGVEVSFAALDADGRRWFFDVSGGFTSNRPGLRRSEVLWKSLGKAAVIRQGYPTAPFVLLTTGVPARQSTALAALSALVGPDRPVHDVIVLSVVDDLDRLRRHAGTPSSALSATAP